MGVQWNHGAQSFCLHKVSNEAIWMMYAVCGAQEVDGEALMYLTRADVVSGLSLQLGPALKLYRLIVNMRTNGNAHKYLYSS